MAHPLSMGTPTGNQLDAEAARWRQCHPQESRRGAAMQAEARPSTNATPSACRNDHIELRASQTPTTCLPAARSACTRRRAVMVMGHRNVPSAAAIDASLASHAHNTFKPCHFCEQLAQSQARRLATVNLNQRSHYASKRMLLTLTRWQISTVAQVIRCIGS